MQVVERANVRVLVVDDDPSIRSLVSRLLEREDLAVDMAADGEEAIRKLQIEEPYSAVVIDLMMPRVTGFDVLEAMKERRPEALKCIIVMSAIGRPLRASDRDVVCAVVQKPFDLASIREAVQTCIQEHARSER